MRAPILLPLPVVALLAACPPPGPGDDGDPPGPVAALGGMLLAQDREPESFWQASASFTTPSAEPNPACNVEDVGGCTFTQCQSAADLAPVEPQAHLDAGALTIASEAREAVLTRDADGIYTGVRTDNEEFFQNGGELFAEAAGGADIEAFNLAVPRAPTPLQMVTPPLASVTVRVTEALVTEWTGNSEGDVIFTLASANLLARCSAPSTAGGFDIPAEIIGRFPLGEGTLTIDNHVVVTADLGDNRSATFTAATQPTSATGANANYFVTFAAP